MIALSITTAARGGDGELFREKVAPILEARCVRCHGMGAKKGGLSLTSAEALRAGGEGGPVVEPGKPGESTLIEKVSGEKPEMPKGGRPLSGEEVAALRKWVEDGAHWPSGVTLRGPKADATGWWAFRPIERPRVPDVKDSTWVRTPIDAFVLAALERKGVRPSPEADRRTLIRRVTFDLTGLPPSPGEIDAYLKDSAPDAYEKVVDRLLASPRYGERWGRHWLDVAHYGDTHGYDKDKRRDHAWPYRDYVIRALNEDRPYARFVREQLAGDVIAPGDPDAVIATGFIAAGPWDFVGHVELREGTVDKEKTRVLDRDDMVSTTMSTFVSMTVHCARCHDHKFDPIPQADYYRLQAVFAGVDRGDRPYPDAGRKALPAGPLVYAPLPHAPRPIHLLRRGDVEQPGDLLGPGALSCLSHLSFDISKPEFEGNRRRALADWIVDRANPLTWRSIVNRAWHYHFGRGLVDTPNDFGRNGSRPSHPELLDWLAAEFRDGGQSLKGLHRWIVCSSVYRQSSRPDPRRAAIDADARLLWRQSRQRLDAEELRDAVLAVAGTLDARMGGPGFELFRFKDDHSPVYDHEAPEAVDAPATRRRTVYRFVVRSVPNPFLDALDCADPNANTPVRNTTMTALQALALLNDPFILRQAGHFADRLRRVSDDPALQIDSAFLLALGRPPRPDERAALAAYAARHGLSAACRLIFNMNEFVFID
jgi:cytochrome c553